ncbi:hypothetical protein [Pyruvatibacter sp.]
MTNVQQASAPSDKPHRGFIRSWRKVNAVASDEYFIDGVFDGHWRFDGKFGHTSLVLSHNSETGEVVTKNSRYTCLPEDELKPSPPAPEETPIGFIAVTGRGEPCGHQGGRLYRFAGTARNARNAEKVYAVRLSDLKEV